jgi:2-dehydro-3-deoxygalactonokinase
LAERKTGQGIAATYKLWKETGGNDAERLAFYQSYLFDQIQTISKQLNKDVGNIPVVLSGMASSSIGMQELPYKQLPVHLDGSDLLVKIIPWVVPAFSSNLVMISGVSSGLDVMRGEETILVGCDIKKANREDLFIFPGTHSKHVRINNGQAHSVSTYLTGELFSLLARHSVLSGSVQQHSFVEKYAESFAAGVNKGKAANLLNSIFQVRVNNLFDKLSKEENYYYLSGLLIGYELKDIAMKPVPVTIVGSGELQKLYRQALPVLGLNDQTQYKDADEALIRGQLKILQQ